MLAKTVPQGGGSRRMPRFDARLHSSRIVPHSLGDERSAAFQKSPAVVVQNEINGRRPLISFSSEQPRIKPELFSRPNLNGPKIRMRRIQQVVHFTRHDHTRYRQHDRLPLLHPLRSDQPR
jgi:hypothetical protein